MIEDKSKKLESWIEHYSELYSSKDTADLAYLDNLLDNPTKHSLDQPPYADKVVNIIKNIWSGKAAGENEISGEPSKASVDLLTESILHLITTCWSTKTVTQDFKYAKITTNYKNKGNREDCNNYWGYLYSVLLVKFLPKSILPLPATCERCTTRVSMWL